MTDHAFYAAQSRITDPGRFADRVAAVPGALTAMRTAARELVFHYRADGDFAANGIEASRIAEVDTRYAEDMLARLSSSLICRWAIRGAGAAAGRLLPGLHRAVPRDGIWCDHPPMVRSQGRLTSR